MHVTIDCVYKIATILFTSYLFYSLSFFLSFSSKEPWIDYHKSHYRVKYERKKNVSYVYMFLYHHYIVSYAFIWRRLLIYVAWVKYWWSTKGPFMIKGNVPRCDISNDSGIGKYGLFLIQSRKLLQSPCFSW